MLLLLGFTATPLLTALVSAVLVCRPCWALLVLLGGLIALRALFGRRGRTTVETGLAWPAVPAAILIVALAYAVAANWSYLPWSMKIPLSNGRFVAGADVFDFEKSMGVTVSLAARGMRPPHFAAPDVDLVYYTGAYIVPAALAGCFPAEVVPVIITHIITTSVVFVVLMASIIWSLNLGNSRAVVIMRWVLLALCLTGLSLELEFLGIGRSLRESPDLSPYWDVWFYIDGVPHYFFWLWQHAGAVAAALAALWLLPRLKETSDTVVWTFASAYVAAASTFVGLPYYAATGAWLAWRLLKPVGAGQGTRGALLIRILISFAVQALLLLPIYRPILAAALSGALVDSGIHTAFECRRSIGALTGTLGIGLTSLILWPLLRRRITDFTPIYLFALILVAVVLATKQNYSDFGDKCISAAQIATPLLLVTCVAALLQSRRPASRGLSVGLLLAILANAMIATAGAFNRVDRAMQASPKILSDELALIEWIQHNTRIDDVVSLADGTKTTFHYLLSRTAAASGEEPFPRLMYVVGNARQIERYRAEASDPAYGWRNSDYVYVPAEGYGLGLSRTGPAPMPAREPERAFAMAERLGFAEVMRNPAGAVFANPARAMRHSLTRPLAERR